MAALQDLKSMVNELYPGHNSYEVPFLLCAWARMNPGDILGDILQAAGSDVSEIIEAYTPLLDDPIPEDKMLLESCVLSCDNKQLSGFHLLLTICTTPESRLYRALAETNVNMSDLIAILKKRIEDLPISKSKIVLKREDIARVDGILLDYGRDLTAQALEGKYEDLADREEIDQIIDVLLKMNKRNIALTGATGVGKTSLIELLALKIACDEIPCLENMLVFEVRLGRVVAGTKYRGEFEQRIYSILDAAEKHGRVILFFDEMHLLWGAGAAEGILTDASNIIKPYLTKDSIRVIGATTHEEYERYIKQDPALERRFQEIKLMKPDHLLIRRIIMKHSKVFEAFHGIRIPDDVVVKALTLSDRYILNRNQPDKCLDLLDMSAVHAKRNGKEEIYIEDLYHTLSNMAGRRIKPREKNTTEVWRQDFHKVFLRQKADVIFISEPNDRQSRALLNTCISQLRMSLLEKSIELLFDEKRFIEYLLSDLRRNDQEATSLFNLVDQKVLKPIAASLHGFKQNGDLVRIALDDDFYNSGKVSLRKEVS